MSEPSPLPRVAVVVPVFRAPDQLATLFATLRRLDWPRASLQFVVAVDGPHQATEECAREAADTVIVLPTNSGSYAARNAALDVLHPDVAYVAFTDADCRVSPGWVREHVSTLMGADLSGGGIRVTTRTPPSPAEYVDRSRHLKQKNYVLIDGYAATANLAVRRVVLEQLRFRSDLRSGGDAEFGRQARELDFRLDYSPDAWVEHPARPTERDVLRKVQRICTGIKANPERWSNREISEPRFSLRLARLAYREGITRSPLWMVRAVGLDYCSDRLIYRAARLSKREAQRRGQDLARGAQ